MEVEVRRMPNNSMQLSTDDLTHRSISWEALKWFRDSTNFYDKRNGVCKTTGNCRLTCLYYVYHASFLIWRFHRLQKKQKNQQACLVLQKTILEAKSLQGVPLERWPVSCQSDGHRRWRQEPITGWCPWPGIGSAYPVADCRLDWIKLVAGHGMMLLTYQAEK